jgi:prophage regulatory protein
MHTILRLPDVKRSTGLSRSTIYLRITQGTFPKPVSLGGRAVGWLEAEVQQWLQRRIEASRSESSGAGATLGAPPLSTSAAARWAILIDTAFNLIFQHQHSERAKLYSQLR